MMLRDKRNIRQQRPCTKQEAQYRAGVNVRETGDDTAAPTAPSPAPKAAQSREPRAQSPEPKAKPSEFAAIQNQEDAPPCSTCGSIMIRSGACYKCANCGTTSGCA